MAQDFTRNYAPPGVYIEESDTTLVSSTGIPPTVVAFCGPALGHQTNIEQVTLATDTPVRLAKQGIDTAGAVVTIAATGETVAGGDYSLTKVWPTADHTGQDYYTDMLLAADPEIDPGTVVFITYDYTDPDYYNPKHFESLEDVKDMYGEPLNTNVYSPGDSSYQYVTSPLALACVVAFQNGATDVWTVAATPPGSGATTDSAKSTARRTALNVAYGKLASNLQVNLIVGVTSGIADADASGAMTDLKTALNTAANDAIYRFGIIGFDPIVTTAPDTLLSTAGAASKRMMIAYAGPAGMNMYSGASNTTFAVGHQFLAAAFAGRMAALPVQYSLTKQVIGGFTGLAGTPLSNSLKSQYAINGIAVVEVDRLGRTVVRHAVTTDVSNMLTREAAIVRAKDALLTALADGMSASGLIGAPIDSDMPLNVKSAVQGILEQATAVETIISYADLGVRQTTTDPSVIEVKFSYKPAFTLNYIVVSFSIDVSTGVTDVATDQTAA